MSFVCGGHFNLLVEKARQKSDAMSKLMQKSDDDIVNETNRYKMAVHDGTCEKSAMCGDTSILIWREPFDINVYSYYKKIQSTYGLYEGTWMEVNQLPYDGDLDDPAYQTNDMLVVSINW